VRVFELPPLSVEHPMMPMALKITKATRRLNGCPKLIVILTRADLVTNKKGPRSSRLCSMDQGNDAVPRPAHAGQYARLAQRVNDAPRQNVSVWR
jgi:hypothetical protein